MGEITIRIGNQTARSARTPSEPFEYAVEKGFNAFEWFPDKDESGHGWDENDLDNRERQRIKQTSVRHDIRLSVHAPWQVNPVEPSARERLQESLKFARDIGAELINLHLVAETGTDSFLKALLPFIRELEKDPPISLSLENTPLTSPEDFNELFAKLGQLCPVSTIPVGMCLDLGHANLCPSTRNDYLAFIDRLGSHVPIIHLHLHENYGDTDSHLPVFTGPSADNMQGMEGFIERLKKREFAGSIILEQWPQPPSLLDQARTRLSLMLGCVPEPDPRHEKTTEEAENTSAMGPGGDMVDKIITMDLQQHSWRNKLQGVHRLLADKDFSPDLPELVTLATYLRFLGTGELSCAEEGGHFRPSRHAETSLHIHERLLEVTAPENAFVLRKIYPWLPSYDQHYLRTEPLTRIRDIAHRNDIPGELKAEIKHTLQNKLHRCAGPEDLGTSSSLLERITAPDADYSPTFVKEFKIFHQELEEFFNAGSLEAQLKAMTGRDDAQEADLIDRFLEPETTVDTLDQQVARLDLLTTLRDRFSSESDNRADAEAQKLRLADIGLEDHAFMLLGLVNQQMASAEGNTPWQDPLVALQLVLKNLELSGIMPEEGQAIGSELSLLRHTFEPSDPEQLLRLKATLDRCERLIDAHSTRVLDLFHETAARLGKGLGVAEHAVKTFCEGDLRGNLVFQLSGLVSSLAGKTRTLASLPPWDALATGTATGQLVAAQHLDNLEKLERQGDEPLIVLLSGAEGDEELPGNVAGILLGHQLPHLSHLGIRARQARVVFATSDSADPMAKFQDLLGRWVALTVNSDGVDLIPATRDDLTSIESKSGQPSVPAVCLTPGYACLPLDQIVIETGGGKADGARRLEELSRLDRAGFKTPESAVIPFGVMENLLQNRQDLEETARELTKRINRINGINGLDEMKNAELEKASQQLRDLINQLDPPEETLQSLREILPAMGPLMVRSSANCEDLAELAGAGLYDSIANVQPSDLGPAICQVWASLWTKRAAMSRKQAGITQFKAHMAVLVQEMLTPDLSFIMHTANPVTGNSNEIYIELAVGLGEILTSASLPGSPYRMVCNKSTGMTGMLSFASFSHALWPDTRGGLCLRMVDYSQIDMTQKTPARETIGRRLAAIGQSVEKAFGQPQDIEGAVIGNKIYLLQSRPQQGLNKQPMP